MKYNQRLLIVTSLLVANYVKKKFLGGILAKVGFFRFSLETSEPYVLLLVNKHVIYITVETDLSRVYWIKFRRM